MARADICRRLSEREAARSQPACVGLALELLAEVGVGYANQRLGPLGRGLPLQIDDAVLGHDIHHVRPWSRDDVAVREVHDDAAPAVVALLVSRGQADERFAALRSIGAADELQLAARAGQMPVAVR